MGNEGLVEYYRRKLLERYTAYINRDSCRKIEELLKTADSDTIAEILTYLQSKKEGA